MDAIIRLFDPSYDLGRIRARKCGRRKRWFGSGECQRLVLECLRDTTEPLSGNALTLALMTRKGLEDSHEVVTAVNKTALAVLRRLMAKGVVRRLARPEGTLVWELLGRQAFFEALVALPIAAPVPVSSGARTLGQDVAEDLPVALAAGVFPVGGLVSVIGQVAGAELMV